MKRAIAINGSSNNDGRTARLLEELGIQIYHLKDGVETARDAILEANTIVFGTPTGLHPVPTELGVFMEPEVSHGKDEGLHASSSLRLCG